MAVFILFVLLPICCTIGGLAGITQFVMSEASHEPSDTSRDGNTDQTKTERRKRNVSPDAGVRAAGHEFAKKLITPALKAPASADFPWDTVTFSTAEPIVDDSGATAQRWFVHGAVDAQNSFGAQVRSNWDVVVLGMDGSFFGVEARLDDEVVFQMDSYRSMIENRRVTLQPPPESATKGEPAVETHPKPEHESTVQQSIPPYLVDPTQLIDVACEPWGKRAGYIEQLYDQYYQRRTKVTKTKAMKRASEFCGTRPMEELDSCRACMETLVSVVYDP